MADYGILIRPNSITNSVASPVKFAEYLASGLQVLISDGIGDFSEFVVREKIGYLINNVVDIDSVDFVKNVKKESIRKLALKGYCKASTQIIEKYLSVLKKN
jgi:glycosyltransferase involved in cell wall biosynthesis